MPHEHSPPLAAWSVYSQERAIERLEAAKFPYDGTESGGLALAWATPFLKDIDPDIGDRDLRRVASDICKKFSGNSDGLELVFHWNNKAENPRKRSEIEAIWCALKSAPENSSVIATPINMAAEIRGGEVAVGDAVEAELKPGDTDAIAGEPQPKKIARAVTNALDQYTVNGQLEEIERRAVDQKPILGMLALTGQATMFYAAPNTGKTLITIALAIEGIKNGLIDPSRLYFINNDDTTKGAAEKARIAEEYEFNMVIESYHDFDVRNLLGILNHMIDHDQARNVIVILDTATKVVNVLDAAKTRAFTRVIRRFVLMGGTFIALAHANKALGPDGKPVYRGTTDIVNDFDCVYVLSQLQANTGEKVVLFEKKKSRGDVVQSAAYSYSTEAGISYHELVTSVQAIDEDKADAFKRIDAVKSDAEVIAAVATCIQAGVISKMLLADAVAERTGISKRQAIKVIERYTGDDPAIHLWHFSVRERGAKVFELLDIALPLPDTKPSTAP